MPPVVPSVVLGPLLRHVDETSATVWVETDVPCEVAVLGCRTRTFCVAGHHYALVVCGGLEPGSTTPYAVVLDGNQAWPPPDDPFPPPTVRTRTGRPEEPLRLLFGSCRVTRPHVRPYTGTWGPKGVGPDALRAWARRMLVVEEPGWPDALLLVGDQVYADELSPETLAHVERTRGTDQPPGWVSRTSRSTPSSTARPGATRTSGGSCRRCRARWSSTTTTSTTTGTPPPPSARRSRSRTGGRPASRAD